MENKNQTAPLPPLNRALLAIEKLEARIKSMENAQREPIAIIGLGCRFPGGANDAESFWQLLRDGVDTVTEVPADRWDIDAYYDADPEAPGKMYTRKGAFLEGVDQFDPQFFGIMPKEAHAMDPQQRLLLETTWEALENAGIPTDSLAGTRTGVYVGILGTDYATIQTSNDGINEVGPYYGSGVAHSIASGRISYLLGLQGPSMSIDTACSSSLVAIHQACLSLRTKETNLALAGGVNLILTPDASIALSKNKMMAADGHCKTFDASADGYVRGEGCGVIVLKRLSDAVADGDNILAVIRGSAVNQDGASSGLTAPNGPSQEAVIRDAVANAGIQPQDITYVETHGTGTSLGDPIEVQALASALGKGRDAKHPLLIGSVKTNVGHLETAAGVVGLVKLIMSLRHKAIPPHLHLKQPNPFIPWAQLPVSVPTTLTPWPESALLIAGLSSFGFSGTNVHIVVSAPPEKEPKKVEFERPSHILTLSAKSESALQALSERVASQSNQDFANAAFTFNTGRAKYSHRLALWADSAEDATRKLQTFATGEETNGLVYGHLAQNKKPKIAFLFTGQGAQYVGMGRTLHDSQPVFRAALDECASLLRPYLTQPLLDVIFAETDSEQAKLLDQTAYTQTALFAIEYSLAKLWQSWGVEPFAVTGHSVGEYVAACIAGVFSLEDGIKLIAERGRLMQSLPSGGKMSAIFAEEEQVREAIQPYSDRVSIAAMNGTTNIVISGNGEAVDAICASLEAKGIKTRSLNVSHAFHSPLVEPILNEFEKAAATLTYKQPQLRLISNLTGQLAMGDVVTNAKYWRDHIRRPVQFVQGIESLLTLNVDILIEVGPSPTLLSMIQRIPSTEGKLAVHTLRQGRDDWAQILESLGRLFVGGVQVNWKGFDAPYARQRLELPTYPFQRQRYWSAPKSRRSPYREENVHPLLGRKLSSPLKVIQFESVLDRESFSFIRDHQVRGTSILPMTAYLELAQAAAKLNLGAGEYQLEDVVIHQPLVLEDEDVRIAHLILNDDMSFEIHSRSENNNTSDWQLHATGRIEKVTEPTPKATEKIQEIQARCNKEFSSEEHYQELNSRGFPFGAAMQGVHHIWRKDGEAVVEIHTPAEISDEIPSFHLHPALLDSCLQGFWSTFDLTDKKTYMPMNFERFVLYRSLPEHLWSHIRLRETGEKQDAVIGDVTVMDMQGQVVAQIDGLYFRPASQQMLHTHHEWDDWFYEVEWQKQETVEELPSQSLFISTKELSVDVDSQVATLAEQHHIERYREMFPRIERLSAGYVVAALREMGLQFQPGQAVSVDDLMSKYGILERYRRLTGRLLDILGGAGFLQHEGKVWKVVRLPSSEMDAKSLHTEWQALLTEYPESKGQLTLTGQCGESLAGVLRGKVDPLSLLFPNGSLELTELLYRESSQPRIFNTMVSHGIQKIIASMPADQPIRILEIGAGTGGTTSYVLPALPAERTEYFFTDISPLFLNRARTRFAQFNFVRYEILNVENDPSTQGFADQLFDIVLAVNVLHATVDMGKTLEHVKKVLKPNGHLLLVEGTNPENWVDITFGLTDGWWRFTDTHIRAEYPLMPRDTWHKLLTDTGFTNSVALPLDESQFQQALILAQSATAAPGQWLIFDDEAGVGKTLADQLGSLNQTSILVKAGESFQVNAGHYSLNPSSVDDFKKLITGVAQSSQPLRGVVYLWSLDIKKAEGMSLEPELSKGLGGAVYVAQALAGSDIEPPRLWLVTRDAQQVHYESLAAEESPLWGLGKVIQLEHPELQCTRIDLDNSSSKEDQARTLFAQIWKPDTEDQIALRNGQRFAARLKRTTLITANEPPLFDGETALQLQSSGNGVLEDLTWKPAALPQPGPGEVAIEVRAAGLNFRDLMNALAMRSDNEALGGECSGIVIAIGPDVTQFKPGDAVLGMARGSFGSVAIADVHFVVHKPEDISFAEAAALPIAYFTAYYCLEHIAKLKKGQKILIHAAAGGVGMAAVQVALRAGAEVFATAGSDTKRNFLHAMGVSHVLNSRTLEFADEILSLTDGQGVDVVLNSLSGEFIAKSVSALAKSGTFIEIGKRDIWTAEQFAKEKPSASYQVIDLAALTEAEPAKTSPIFKEVMELIRFGELKRLPITAFTASNAPAAFRHMAQAMQIGKIVITNHGYRLRSDGTYLITGGLNGLGLLTARHFAERGARHLALVGRSAPSSTTEAAIRELEAKGVRVQVVQADVSKVEDVRHILSTIQQDMPALRGIVHAAGVLDDASILRQEWSKFARVLAPKVDGAWHLHSLTMNEPLDFFILYSSTAALLGSPGQSNHSAANTFMDMLAHDRQTRGLPALSINWGIWSVIGSAAERKADEWMHSQGVGTIRPEDGLEMLDALFAQEKAQIAVLPINWSTYLSQFKAPPMWLSLLAEESRRKGKRSSTTSTPTKKPTAKVETQEFQQRLANVPPNQQRQFLLEHVHAQVVKAIGLEAGQEIDPRQALNELGLDSLMAVELRNMLSNSLKLERNLPATLVFDYPTINALTDYLAQDILKLETKKEEKKVTPAAKTDVLKDIESLSDEEVARMLSDLQ